MEVGQARRFEREDGHLQLVARLRAINVHRAGDRVDTTEVHPGQVGGTAGWRDLTAAAFNHLELDRFAWGDMQGWGYAVVPAEMGMMPVDRVHVLGHKGT